MTIQPGEIGHIIQLATAPVFLLTGVGTNMLVLTNRLARIIDRTRVLEERLVEGAPTITDKARAGAFDELDVLFYQDPSTKQWFDTELNVIADPSI